LVKRADIGTPMTFSIVGEIDQVSPGDLSRNKIETSTHNDGTESHVLGILRKADPSFHINYVGSDSTHAAILSDIAANTKAQWQILYPSGVSRTGPAYVMMFKFDDAPVDGKQGAQVTLTWSGAVVEAAS
jgi:hypothetical protein